MTEDQNVLTNGDWLNDRIVDAINKVIAVYLGFDQHQSTLMSQTATGFDAAMNENIQILHENNHWVASAYINGHLMIADSLTRPLSEYVIRQLKQLYAHALQDDGTLTVELVPCAKQSNGIDCGVFAAAFAFEWACASQDLNAQFDRRVMRDHLKFCLENQQVIQFPKLRATVNRKIYVDCNKMKYITV